MEPPSTIVSLDEYLALDEAGEERLEYRGGHVVALVVPSARHEFIVQNIALLLGPAIKRRGYIYGTNAAKVVTPGGSRAIPDFVASCDDRDLANVSQDGEFLLRHPWLVVEVLSTATEGDDRGAKLDDYETISELTHYVLVDSQRRNVTLYRREASHPATLAHHARVVEIDLPVLETTLRSEDVYAGTGVPVVAAAD